MLEASEASVRLFEAESGSIEAMAGPSMVMTGSIEGMTGSAEVMTGSMEAESREAPGASRKVVSSWFTITSNYVNSKSIPENKCMIKYISLQHQALHASTEGFRLVESRISDVNIFTRHDNTQRARGH